MVMSVSIKNAASRQSGVEGSDGSVGLRVIPLEGVTLSDGYDPRTRADPPFR
jgi:hypothetical protein